MPVVGLPRLPMPGAPNDRAAAPRRCRARRATTRVGLRRVRRSVGPPGVVASRDTWRAADKSHSSRAVWPNDSDFGLCASSGLASATRRITGISASANGPMTPPRSSTTSDTISSLQSVSRVAVPMRWRARTNFHGRVAVVGLLGSVCPVIGPNAAPGSSIVGLAATFQGLLDPLRSVLGTAIGLAVQPVVPFGHFVIRLYASRMPAGDRKVLADPEMEAMFLDDIANASGRRFGAVAHDVALFGRPWGFDLTDINVPVFWWHGDADNVIPLTHAEHSVKLLRTVELEVRGDGEPSRRFCRRRRRPRDARTAWDDVTTTHLTPTGDRSKTTRSGPMFDPPPEESGGRGFRTGSHRLTSRNL